MLALYTGQTFLPQFIWHWNAQFFGPGLPEITGTTKAVTKQEIKCFDSGCERRKQLKILHACM